MRLAGPSLATSAAISNSKNPERSIRAVSFGQMEAPQPIPWIVPGLIPGGGHASMIYGAGGDGKSVLTLGLAIAIANGHESWMGYPLNKTNVLYLDFELDQDVQNKRASDLKAGYGDTCGLNNIHYFPALGMHPTTAFMEALDDAKRLDCGLIVVDSVGPAMDGDAEASSDVLSFLKKNVDPIKAAGISPLLVDHQAKVIKGERASDKLPFGSVYKFNMCRSVIQLSSREEDDAVSTTLEQKKTNFGKKQANTSVKIVFGDDFIELQRKEEADIPDAKEPAPVEVVFKALVNHGPMYAEEIKGVTGFPKSSVQNHITQLKNSGRVEATGEKSGNALQVRAVEQSLDDLLLGPDQAA